jgi:hypothetical protein
MLTCWLMQQPGEEEARRSRLMMRMRFSLTKQRALNLQDGFKQNRYSIVWNVFLSSRTLQIADRVK